jgi:hypothetical protein
MFSTVWLHRSLSITSCVVGTRAIRRASARACARAPRRAPPRARADLGRGARADLVAREQIALRALEPIRYTHIAVVGVPHTRDGG